MIYCDEYFLGGGIFHVSKIFRYAVAHMVYLLYEVSHASNNKNIK